MPFSSGIMSYIELSCEPALSWYFWILHFWNRFDDLCFPRNSSTSSRFLQCKIPCNFEKWFFHLLLQPALGIPVSVLSLGLLFLRILSLPWPLLCFPSFLCLLHLTSPLITHFLSLNWACELFFYIIGLFKESALGIFVPLTF